MSELSISFSLRARAALAAIFLAPLAGAPAFSQPREVSINVGFGVGGVYHTMAMALGRHMGRHMPGQPNMVVRAMPGAGSLLAANHIANVAPRDGSTLAVIGGGAVLEPLFRNPDAKFDPAKLNWIGSTSTEHFVCVVMRDSNIKSIEDLRNREVAVGSTGRGSRTYTYPAALNQLLGARFRIVTGYRGMTDIHLAMERRELDSVCGWGYSSVPSQKPDWLKESKINILLQFATKPHPEVDAPIIFDVLKDERDKAAMRLLILDSYVAWPIVAPPGVPAETVAGLRRAYQATMGDPAFLAEAKQLRLVIDPVKGEDLQSFVEAVSATPREIVDHARKLSGL
jgi:tripartite-type tricarboxylate transporter receptor subunit TctC